MISRAIPSCSWSPRIIRPTDWMTSHQIPSSTTAGRVSLPFSSLRVPPPDQGASRHVGWRPSRVRRRVFSTCLGDHPLAMEVSVLNNSAVLFSIPVSVPQFCLYQLALILKEMVQNSMNSRRVLSSPRASRPSKNVSSCTQ